MVVVNVLLIVIMHNSTRRATWQDRALREKRVQRQIYKKKCFKKWSAMQILI